VRRPNGRQKVVALLAGNPGFVETFSIRVARGRNITDGDDAGRRRVCLLGDAVAAELFPHGEDPLGQTVDVGADSYHVIGVAAHVSRFGVNFGWDWNDFILVPDETLLPDSPGRNFPGWMPMVTDDAAHNEIAKRVLNSLISSRHREVDDFRIFDFATALAKWYKIFAIMEVIVGLLAGIALLVGGVGVMNILLVSVRERVREIGVRKALGATPAAIRAQFITEAVVLALVGGSLGALGGMGAAVLAARVIRHFQETWVGVVSHGATVSALVVSALVGLVFGYVPARRASGLDPVECLRA
jgi:putative ABC transport system permease protein